MYVLYVLPPYSNRYVIGIYSSIKAFKKATEKFLEQYSYNDKEGLKFATEKFNTNSPPELDVVPYNYVYRNGEWEEL